MQTRSAMTGVGTRRPRAAFDTNVFVSALLSRNPSSLTRELLARFAAGDFIAWRERFREAWALLAKAPWPALRPLAWQAETYDSHDDADQALATREETGRVRGGVA